MGDGGFRTATPKRRVNANAVCNRKINKNYLIVCQGFTQCTLFFPYNWSSYKAVSNKNPEIIIVKNGKLNLY